MHIFYDIFKTFINDINNKILFDGKMINTSKPFREQICLKWAYNFHNVIAGGLTNQIIA